MENQDQKQEESAGLSYSALELEKRAGLSRMRGFATGLLLLMVLAYTGLHFAPGDIWWLQLLTATTEAAMIGALADWFAVTALFRRPLGLPIPHTAIVQTRKDSIAEQFGQFVQENFLSEALVSRRIRTLHPSEKVAAWLQQPENAALIVDQILKGLSGLLKVINDEDVRRLIERSMEARIRKTSFAPILGELAEFIANPEREKELVNAFVRMGQSLLQDANEQIRDKVAAETPGWFPKAVDKAIYQRIIRGVRETLDEVQMDADHPTRQRMLERVHAFIEQLKHSTEMQQQEEHIKEELLSHPAMRDFSASLWQDVQSALLKRTETEAGELDETLRSTVQSFGRAIVEDPQLAARTDALVESAARYLISRFGSEVAELISGTIRSWDSKATAELIEVQIGRDLQFIRINGTVVGGLIGLLLFVLTGIPGLVARI